MIVSIAILSTLQYQHGSAHLRNVLVKCINRLVQLSASLLDRLADALVCSLPVLLKLLVDLVGAITGLGGEFVDLLASVGGEDLGVFADLGALAGDVVLSGVLDLGCVGWWRSWLARV